MRQNNETEPAGELKQGSGAPQIKRIAGATPFQPSHCIGSGVVSPRIDTTIVGGALIEHRHRLKRKETHEPLRYSRRIERRQPR